MLANWLIDHNTIIHHHSLKMRSPVQYLLENHKECHMLWTNTPIKQPYQKTFQNEIKIDFLYFI